MCGKFTQMYSWSTLVGLYRGMAAEPGSGSDGEDREERLTPMRFANVLALDENGERQLFPMRWGLTVPWQDKKVIHARCETIDKRPTFREAFSQRRGILVVKTFNEGKEVPSSKPGGKSRTEQYVVRPRDDKPVSIAVIFQRVSEPNGATLWEFAMVTTPNNKLIGTITDRMPAILQPADWTQWLGEEPATTEELKAMLKPFEGDWDMGPEKPDPPPSPTRSSKPPPPRKTDKPSQGRLFE